MFSFVWRIGLRPQFFRLCLNSLQIHGWLMNGFSKFFGNLAYVVVLCFQNRWQFPLFCAEMCVQTHFSTCYGDSIIPEVVLWVYTFFIFCCTYIVYLSYGIEKKQFPYMLCITNMLLHGIDVPKIYHENSLLRDVLDYTTDDQFDVILMNIWTYFNMGILSTCNNRLSLIA